MGVFWCCVVDNYEFVGVFMFYFYLVVCMGVYVGCIYLFVDDVFEFCFVVGIEYLWVMVDYVFVEG